MIEIKLKFTPGAKELYLLNMPFQTLIKQKQEESDRMFLSRLSSYHDPFGREPDWFVYYGLGSGLEIIIAGGESELSSQKMFDFMIKNNGFALSRDNLFALWSIDKYREQLISYIEKNKKSFVFVALAHPDILPHHENGPKICPMIEIEYRDNEINAPNYDWSWIDSKNMSITNFAFFRKVPHKPIII